MRRSDNLRRGEGGLASAWTLAAIGALLALLSLVYLLRPVPVAEPPPLIRAALVPPDSFGSAAQGPKGSSDVAVAPDGRSIAFIAADQLWTRPLDGIEATLVDGTKGAFAPFWSPDSLHLGFFADGELRRVSIGGGAVETVCAAPRGRGGTWGRDGRILFSPDARSAIHIVDAAGGEPSPLTSVDGTNHSTHRWPEILPDGRSFLFFASSHGDPLGRATGVFVGSVETGEFEWLLRAESKAVWSAGRVLFMRDGVLLARKFDPGTRQIWGEIETLAGDVRYRGPDWAAMFSASRQEVLAYEIGTAEGRGRPVWIDRLGGERGTVDSGDVFWDLRLSPQRDRLALAFGAPEPRLGVVELDGKSPRPRPLTETFSRSPVWSPGGERLVFAGRRPGGRIGMFVIAADGSGSAELLLDSAVDQVPTDWSADGRWLAFEQGNPAATELWILPMDGSSEPLPFVQDPAPVGEGRFSPDGRWLLFTAREAGVHRVFIASFPGAENRWPVSAGGWADNGRWSAAGDAVYFASARTMLMEVAVRRRKKDGGLDVGVPRMLFPFREDESLFRGRYGLFEVDDDRERFILLQAAAGDRSSDRLMLVVPWTAHSAGLPAPGEG